MRGIQVKYLLFTSPAHHQLSAVAFSVQHFFWGGVESYQLIDSLAVSLLQNIESSFSLVLYLYLNCCCLDAVFSSCIDPPFELTGNKKYPCRSDTTKSEPVVFAAPTLQADQPLLTDVKGVTNCALLLI